MSRRPFPTLLAPLLAALALTGCAGADPDAAGSSSATSSLATATSPSGASPSAPTTAPGRLIEVQALVGGQVTGDTGRVTVPLGETVTLVVETIAPDEVHVHGYDLTSPVSPFSPAELTFEATISGVFEVELHEAGTLLLTLQVQ